MINWQSVVLGIYIALILGAYITSLCYGFTYGIVISTLFIAFMAISIGVDMEKKDREVERKLESK